MTGIILSIILILGGAGGPTGDFNDANAVAQPAATSQSTTNVRHSK